MKAAAQAYRLRRQIHMPTALAPGITSVRRLKSSCRNQSFSGGTTTTRVTTSFILNGLKTYQGHPRQVEPVGHREIPQAALNRWAPHMIISLNLTNVG